jgi:NitT/TauT family transport system permease protein
MPRRLLTNASVVESRIVGEGEIRHASAATHLRSAIRQRLWVETLTAGATWLVAATVTLRWHDAIPWERTNLLGELEYAVGFALIVIGLVGRSFPFFNRVRSLAAWLIAIPISLLIWEVLTAKLALLPLPFFAPPQSVLEAFTDDWRKLADSMLHSLLLLLPGYLIGSIAGVLVGVSIGWSPRFAYWGHPVLRFVGPLPATAWLPIAFYFFHSSWSAGVFLITLTTGFPVALLTASGVANVHSAYYDIARTLGANNRFLVWKVAVPAAMPQIFVGLFMGLSTSFAVLIVAEMMGVKAGFGYYIQWAQGWGAYSNVYAALAIMAVLFSGLISLLFAVRSRLLAWQKGSVRW